MAINLQKGQRISLSKEAPGLKKIICGLGWDVVEQNQGSMFDRVFRQNYDLDASVICLDSNGKITDISNIIYFGNLKHGSGSITHLGDNLTGEGDGDDEQIIVNLPLVPTQISKLIFTVNIYRCVGRKQDFSQIKNAFVRLVNMSDNKELARYNLSGTEYKGMTGMIMAELYRHKEEWKLAAIGNGVNVNGLEEIVRYYM
ncbi:MAG: tellurium resistance TerZ family protein [Cyanobacteria bacterium REEB494]|uniref:TerD family protein n=1 Tax=Cylindrospermopsis raciborskii TaxID=77022 RepID=UPI002ED98FE0|nr:tellurium resistance TerZ family protein [Cyanobacteria bacterium REEB494]